MNNTLGIITEIGVLIFNILIYMQLTVLKKDNIVTRLVMYIGCVVILAVFFVCTYYLKMPEALTSFVFVTLPSFILFFVLSKYKDFRFFVTFCFLDTVTMIITFLSRAMDIAFGHIAGVVTAVVVMLFMLIAYIKGKPLFQHYRELLRNIKDGWGSMAVATLAIYILLIFSASYPMPLVKRPEYLLPYAVMSLTFLAVYAVFVISLVQKRKLCDLNEQLINEKKWHKIAYEDALTGVMNRMAYIERINELEKEENPELSVHAIMIDVDNFKHINDSLGHHFGDVTLKRTAEYVKTIFPDDKSTVFRIGGDEFAVLTIGMTDREIDEKLMYIAENSGDELGCSLSAGCSAVNFAVNNSVEVAFEIADRKMYQQKMGKTV